MTDWDRPEISRIQAPVPNGGEQLLNPTPDWKTKRRNCHSETGTQQEGAEGLQGRTEDKPRSQGTERARTFMDQRGEKSRDQRTRREIRENPSLHRKELVEDPHPL